jgi:hypothetical protein
MEGLGEVVARLPLAEAVLRLWRWAADEAFLGAVYEEHRGRSFTRVLSFPLLVHLIADALLVSEASGRETFERAQATGELPVSIQAAYGKLRRMPPRVSEALLTATAARLQALHPGGVLHEVPECVSDLDVIVIDGKTIKGLQKRLKPLRGVGGGAVGGKALVALHLRSGLVVGLRTALDGNANEVLLTPDVLADVRIGSDRRHLWIGDRANSYVEQVSRLGAGADEFLVRRRADISFEPDPAHADGDGLDFDGRGYRETWGWLSRHKQPRAVYVRHISMTLESDEELCLITSLLDAQAYPAAELLALYRQRWQIERVFQELTQVFGLKPLIGSSPQASIFQFAFCLLLYNTLQIVRAVLAQQQDQPPAEVSCSKLLRDVRRQLAAWMLVIGPQLTLHELPLGMTKASLQTWLAQRLHTAWQPYWRKGPLQKRNTHPPPRGPGKHVSAQRLIDAARPKRRRKCK